MLYMKIQKNVCFHKSDLFPQKLVCVPLKFKNNIEYKS